MGHLRSAADDRVDLLQGYHLAAAVMRIAVDKKRLQKEIDELALITEGVPPVVTRVLFSEADLRGREFVNSLCREAGLALRMDAVGNMFARWEGTDNKLPAIATGSH